MSEDASPPAPPISVELADVLEDAATALAGIAEALECRTAVDTDDMLEMLAEVANHHARALRDVLE